MAALARSLILVSFCRAGVWGARIVNTSTANGSQTLVLVSGFAPVVARTPSVTTGGRTTAASWDSAGPPARISSSGRPGGRALLPQMSVPDPGYRPDIPDDWKSGKTPGKAEELGGKLGKFADELGDKVFKLGQKAKDKLVGQKEEREDDRLVNQSWKQEREDERLMNQSPLMKEVDAALDQFPVFGGLMKQVVRQGAKELRAAYRSTQEVVEDATVIMCDNQEFLRRMGAQFPRDIQVGMPMQQVSSSSSINGMRTENVQVLLPVQGPAGMGQARVLTVAVDGGRTSLEIEVTTPDGRTMNLSGSQPGDDSIIDIDAGYW